MRRPSGLRRSVQRLSGAFGLTKSDKDLMKSMFSSSSIYVPVYTSEFHCEIAFGFWGYVKNDEARLRLLEFLFSCMQPRLYMAGETLPGHFMEAVMIVKLDRLHMHRDAFANWIDAFFDIMPMSAGTTVFEQYLGEQMLTSMRRIQHSTKLRTNSFTEWNKDFLRLYLKLQKDRTEQERVMSFTGLPFTSDNFIDIHQNIHQHSSLRWPRYNNNRVVDSSTMPNVRQILVRTVLPQAEAPLAEGPQTEQGEMVPGPEAPEAEAPEAEAPEAHEAEDGERALQEEFLTLFRGVVLHAEARQAEAPQAEEGERALQAEAPQTEAPQVQDAQRILVRTGSLEVEHTIVSLAPVFVPRDMFRERRPRQYPPRERAQRDCI